MKGLAKGQTNIKQGGTLHGFDVGVKLPADFANGWLAPADCGNRNAGDAPQSGERSCGLFQPGSGEGVCVAESQPKAWNKSSGTLCAQGSKSISANLKHGPGGVRGLETAGHSDMEYQIADLCL
jgi:hypothetical protein